MEIVDKIIENGSCEMISEIKCDNCFLVKHFNFKQEVGCYKLSLKLKINKKDEKTSLTLAKYHKSRLLIEKLDAVLE